MPSSPFLATAQQLITLALAEAKAEFIIFCLSAALEICLELAAIFAPTDAYQGVLRAARTFFVLSLGILGFAITQKFDQQALQYVENLFQSLVQISSP